MHHPESADDMIEGVSVKRQSLGIALTKAHTRIVCSSRVDHRHRKVDALDVGAPLNQSPSEMPRSATNIQHKLPCDRTKGADDRPDDLIGDRGEIFIVALGAPRPT